MPGIEVERVIFPQKSNQLPVIDEVEQHSISLNYTHTTRTFGPEAIGKVPNDK